MVSLSSHIVQQVLRRAALGSAPVLVRLTSTAEGVGSAQSLREALRTQVNQRLTAYQLPRAWVSYEVTTAPAGTAGMPPVVTTEVLDLLTYLDADTVERGLGKLSQQLGERLLDEAAGLYPPHLHPRPVIGGSPLESIGLNRTAYALHRFGEDVARMVALQEISVMSAHGLRGGGIGGESEETYAIDVPAGTPNGYGTRILKREGVTVKIDTAGYFEGSDGRLYENQAVAAAAGSGGHPRKVEILEIITPPISILPGEDHEREEAVFAILSDIWQRLGTVPDSGMKVGQIFPRAAGYRVSIPDGVVRPVHARHPRYVQWTVGIPLSGIYSFLTWLSVYERTPFEHQRTALVEALDFGRRVGGASAAWICWPQPTKRQPWHADTRPCSTRRPQPCSIRPETSDTWRRTTRPPLCGPPSPPSARPCPLSLPSILNRMTNE